jgi:hypothetical protein
MTAITHSRGKASFFIKDARIGLRRFASYSTAVLLAGSAFSLSE